MWGADSRPPWDAKTCFADVLKLVRLCETSHTSWIVEVRGSSSWISHIFGAATRNHECNAKALKTKNGILAVGSVASMVQARCLGDNRLKTAVDIAVKCLCN